MSGLVTQRNSCVKNEREVRTLINLSPPQSWSIISSIRCDCHLHINGFTKLQKSDGHSRISGTLQHSNKKGKSGVITIALDVSFSHYYPFVLLAVT